MEELEEYLYFLKSMRKSIGLSRKKMSDEIGINEQCLADWETGKRTVPYPEYLEKKIRQVVKKYHQSRRAG